jgi:hypothetical protein
MDQLWEERGWNEDIMERWLNASKEELEQLN